MPQKLDFEAASDRELLLLTAQSVNSIEDKVTFMCRKIDQKADKKTVNTVLSAVGVIVLGVIAYVLKHIGFPQ